MYVKEKFDLKRIPPLILNHLDFATSEDWNSYTFNIIQFCTIGQTAIIKIFFTYEIVLITDIGSYKMEKSFSL